ncbi:hypothetical protein LUZ61_005669 [Rhynchospora tenuis]|uniref:F-box domain-containing protein n=1 Tax=Rhynchospora tenuis TaxID=198213 RepID=A0AAD6EUX5_9POAL|nr:hypothetical protein LUZ61_005669 [Rhynchospora tenuis]
MLSRAKKTCLTKPSPAAEGSDLISQLSDCILHSILSFLRVKDAARTSVLSSRWRHLWKEAPLRLEDSLLCDNEQLVSRIYYSHRGPIESLRLCAFTQATMNRFAESAVQRASVAKAPQVCLEETPRFHVKATPCRMKILSSVKTLAIKIKPTLNKTIPEILRCFPFLENLFIMKYERSGSGYNSDKDFWDEQGSLSFLDHLKIFHMRGFYGDQSDVEFLRYLVLYGKVLKKVTLRCAVFVCQKFVETKRRQVCIEERASSDLELVFYLDDRSVDKFPPWKEAAYEMNPN